MLRSGGVLDAVAGADVGERCGVGGAVVVAVAGVVAIGDVADDSAFRVVVVGVVVVIAGAVGGVVCTGSVVGVAGVGTTIWGGGVVCTRGMVTPGRAWGTLSGVTPCPMTGACSPAVAVIGTLCVGARSAGVIASVSG